MLLSLMSLGGIIADRGGSYGVNPFEHRGSEYMFFSLPAKHPPVYRPLDGIDPIAAV